jgi:hypothetical protein
MYEGNAMWDLLANVWQFISGIDPIIKAAVLASMVTFLGVGLANRSSRRALAIQLQKQLRDQLSHDSEQRDQQRKMEYRCKLASEAIEALAKRHLGIIRYFDPDWICTSISENEVLNATIVSRLESVASCETIRMLHELDVRYTKLGFNLAVERRSVVELSRRIRELEEVRSTLKGADWEACGREIKALYDKRYEEHRTIVHARSDDLKEIMRLYVRSLAQIRKDIGMPVEDEEAFFQLYRYYLERMTVSLDEHLEMLKAQGNMNASSKQEQADIHDSALKTPRRDSKQTV